MAKGGKRLTNKPSSNQKPLTEGKTQNKDLVIPKADKDLPFISFSFRYFGQQDYFGFGDQDASWFANLFDRIKDLSGKTTAILENPAERKAYRLHPIDWNAKNCPITIADLVSVPKNIKDSAEKDFFWQFQLSKGTGRVIGFFNEDLTTFYIVLLDPKHNIQPSKDYGYAVNETQIAITEYERIEMWIAEAAKNFAECRGDKQNCPLSRINDEYLHSGIFYACIDSELKETYNELVESGEFQKQFENFLLTRFLK